MAKAKRRAARTSAKKSSAKPRAAKTVVRKTASASAVRQTQKAVQLTGEAQAAIRQANATFARGLPQAVLASGSMEMQDHALGSAEHPEIPNGCYRVSGSDWLLTFKKGQLVLVERGGPRTRADSYIDVPGDPPSPGPIGASGATPQEPVTS